MSSKVNLENRYLRRRKLVLKAIKGEAALFCSSEEFTQSRDLKYPFRQNSDLYYLSGIEEADSALLLIGGARGLRSVLYLRDRNPEHERWEGERLGIKRAKRRCQVDEVRPIDSLASDIPELLKEIRVLHYAPGSNRRIDSIIWSLLCTPTGPSVNAPHTLHDARLLTSQMRVKKDRDEIRSLKHVCDITAEAFYQLL